jgi:hypothetical protein
MGQQARGEAVTVLVSFAFVRHRPRPTRRARRQTCWPGTDVPRPSGDLLSGQTPGGTGTAAKYLGPPIQPEVSLLPKVHRSALGAYARSDFRPNSWWSITVAPVWITGFS